MINNLPFTQYIKCEESIEAIINQQVKLLYNQLHKYFTKAYCFTTIT